jgi:tetratricopeptide (TPR) repeat protein
VLAVAVVVAAYSNSLDNSFHFDDSHVVVENLFVRDLRNLPRIFRDATTFSSLPVNAVYRPLVTATLAVDYRLGGGQVRQFHISQIAMLLLLGVMLYGMWMAVLRAAGEASYRWLALAAALLFTIHTTNTETLNLISARSELLSGLGVVGSFLVYLYVPRSRRLHLYLLPMMVGALAKTPAVIFAPLFLAYVYLFEQRLSLTDLFSHAARPAVLAAIRRSLPAFVVGIATYVIVEAQNAPTVNYAGGSPYQYFLTQLFVWLHYGRLFLFPIGLTADTDWSLIPHWYDTRVVGGALFIAALAWVLARASRTPAGRPAAFGLAWFCLALLPGSSIVPLAEVSNEHRFFLPYMGLAFAAVWGLVQLARRQQARRPGWGRAITATAVLVLLLAIGGNAVGTYERNKVWTSEETLWRDVVEKSPANGRGLMNYGLSQMAKGQFAAAKQLFDRALVYNPNYWALEINLGIVNGRLSDQAAAERHFQRALQLAPDDPDAHFFFARWLDERGRTAEAVPHLERAIALSPARIAARHLLMEVYAKAGRTAESRALAESTLQLTPGDTRAARFLSDRPPVPARTSADGAETADDLMNLSLARYQARDFQGSIDAARKALAQRPEYAEAHNNIAASFASLGKWDEAIEAAREALRLKPDFPLARNNLAWAESEKQKAGGAK